MSDCLRKSPMTDAVPLAGAASGAAHKRLPVLKSIAHSLWLVRINTLSPTAKGCKPGRRGSLVCCRHA